MSKERELTALIRKSAHDIENDGTPSQVGLSVQDLRAIADYMDRQEERIESYRQRLDDMHERIRKLYDAMGGPTIQ